ncbi:DUF997 family protein [Shewanella corallii]|uniref:DUF997 family protein n=1 Tax=Shewanella corallii TaxID=560080 RepID=A0ABT0N859_9GAMM|nr:DUF997 family protein [Shewanella corallii]MCL2914330.1 DUF997 family protein [Shewanella corallii]
MFSLPRLTLFLTLGYFLLWCAGPLLLSDLPLWHGLPVWFWFSCLMAPAILLLALIGLRAGNKL